MQSSEMKLVDNSGVPVSSLSLRNAFNNPNILKNDPAKVDQIMKGLAAQVAQENDVLLVDDIRNFLFGPPGAGGLDLGALDIQRGRDHGILDFNALRPAYGLAPLISVNQLTADPALRAKLLALYGNINNIDAFIGGIAENHVPGSSLGSMLTASFQDQFSRLRDGDRFFYTGDPELRSGVISQVINIDSVTLSDIIRMNTGITNLQSNVFLAQTPEPSGLSLVCMALIPLLRRRRAR